MKFLLVSAFVLGVDTSGDGPTGCKNFAFVSILKSGGRSVTNYFGKTNTAEEIFLNSLRLPCAACGNMHEVAARNQGNELGKSRWNGAYTFAVIRNPFDWVSSLFFYEKVMCLSARGVVSRIERATGTDSYLCGLNETQLQRPEHVIFREWLEVMDSQSSSRNTEFLLPNPAAFPLHNTGFPFSQYAWLSTADGLEVSVDRLYKFEDTEAMEAVANPGKLLRQLCDYVPSWVDNNATSSLETMHPLANSTALYDTRSCEIVVRRLHADFHKFSYSTTCPAHS